MKQPVVHFGDSSLARLDAVISDVATDRIFLVADPVAYRASGASCVMESALARREVIRFTEFGPNPDIADVERGVDAFKRWKPGVVIAVGGGATLDVAKAITRLADQDASPRTIVTAEAPMRTSGPPLVAIPTTAGSGSESTHFAVVYVDGVKHSLAHESILPDFAIIDPLLTHSLPAEVTASSGLDALCQAVESIWAVGATNESVEYASQALSLALKHLTPAVHHPTPEARRGMCEAAHLAGKAINISKTTAPHALSYALTIQHGVAHGFAVALTLVPFLRFNSQLSDADCNDPRGVDAVRERIGRLLKVAKRHDIETATARLEDLIHCVGGPTRFTQIGIGSPETTQKLAHSVNAERLANNPRAIDLQGIRVLLQSIY